MKYPIVSRCQSHDFPVVRSEFLIQSVVDDSRAAFLNTQVQMVSDAIRSANVILSRF
nr:hypothetical protein [uncultured bacterium]